jgi:hypothetical protein
MMMLVRSWDFPARQVRQFSEREEALLVEVGGNEG